MTQSYAYNNVKQSLHPLNIKAAKSVIIKKICHDSIPDKLCKCHNKLIDNISLKK